MTSSDASVGVPANSRYRIRRAQATDLDRLNELLLALQDHLESANPDLWRMKPEARGNLKGQLAARLNSPSSCTLVAEHAQDGVVGVIFGRIIVNNRYTPSRAGQVDQAFVRADHRRAGLATSLIAWLCEFFAIHQVDDITLRYAEGNEEATRFWATLGFSPRIVTVGVSRQRLEARLVRLQKR